MSSRRAESSGQQVDADAAAGERWRSRYEAFRQQIRQHLLTLLDVFSPLPDVAAEDLQKLQDATQHLSGLFSLVMLGEFNSGKSTLINALLGAHLLPEGATPTTDRIHMITYGPAPAVVRRGDEIIEWTYPAEWLRAIYLVDTPGTNTVFRQHEERVRHFMHRSDLLFFLIAANRPFAETDRLYMDLLREFGAKTVLVVSQTDRLGGPDELAQVLAYVRETARRLFGIELPIVPVSARLAFQAAEATDPGERGVLHAASGMDGIWEIIRRETSAESRARQSLLTSLRVGRWLLNRYRPLVEGQLAQWQEDIAFVGNVEAQLATYQREAIGRLPLLTERLDATIAQIDERARQSLQEDYSLGNVGREIARHLLRVPFLSGPPREEKEGALSRFLQVDAPEQLGDLLHDVEASVRREGEAMLRDAVRHVNRYLSSARTALASRMVGEIRVPPPETSLATEWDDMARELQQTLCESELVSFVQRWTALARGAWWRTISWEIIVLIAALALSYYVRAFVPVEERTGLYIRIVAGAIALGSLAFVLLPLRRAWARRALHRAIAQLRKTLQAQIAQRVQRQVQRYRDMAGTAITPFSRLVRTEEARIRESTARLDQVEAAMLSLETTLVSGQEG